jgi:hypothetical protein
MTSESTCILVWLSLLVHAEHHYGIEDSILQEHFCHSLISGHFAALSKFNVTIQARFGVGLGETSTAPLRVERVHSGM